MTAAAAKAPGTVQDLLDIRLTVVGGSALISVVGEIDLSTAPRLLEAVDACIGLRARRISIDLSGITFCDCAGLNAFDRARSRVTAAGGKLHLLAPSSPVLRLFSIIEGYHADPPVDGIPPP